MRFGISTLRRIVCALIVGLMLFVGSVLPTEAQRRHGRGRPGVDRHDRGRHRGWTRGRHRGWSHSRHRGVRRDFDDLDDRRLRRRALRRDRRLQRRTYRTRTRGDRVFLIGPPVRELNRHQQLERRQLREHQRAERRQFRESRRNRF